MIPIWKKNSKTNLIQPPDFLKLFLIINWNFHMNISNECYLPVWLRRQAQPTLLDHGHTWDLLSSTSAKTGNTENCPGRLWTKHFVCFSEQDHYRPSILYIGSKFYRQWKQTMQDLFSLWRSLIKAQQYLISSQQFVACQNTIWFF